MQTLPSFRNRFLMEALEYRYFLTIVPIDATAGVPFDGIVATGLRLPEYATSLELINVMINGQYDYYPTAVVRPDGSFDLIAKFTPQRSGTADTYITFRNDRTGGWDLLDSGQQTIKPGHFDARMPDEHKYSLLPGTLMRDAVATFNTTELTRSLDEYVVEVDWAGKTLSGHLAFKEDGSVGAYVEEAYVPLNRDMDVFVSIRLKDAAPDAPAVGHARTYVSTSGLSIGIGMFYGTNTSDTTFEIRLPRQPRHAGANYHFFIPVAEVEDWETTFAVNLLWTFKDDTVAVTTGSVVRHDDGSYSVVGEVPNVRFDNGQIKIRETVDRPAVGGAPAETYTIEYVGSFNLVDQLPPHLIPPPASEQPSEGEGEGEGDDGTTVGVVGGGGGAFEVDDMLDFSRGTRFDALADRDPFAAETSAFRSILSNVLGNDDESLIAGETIDAGEEPPA